MTWLKAVFAFLGQLARFLADRQLVDAGRAAGRAEQAAAASEEIAHRVEQAEAVARADEAGTDSARPSERLGRLRRRFDRAAPGGGV